MDTTKQQTSPTIPLDYISVRADKNGFIRNLFVNQKWGFRKWKVIGKGKVVPMFN
jgi:hypothetical protein